MSLCYECLWRPGEAAGFTEAGGCLQADSAMEEIPTPELSVEEVWSGAEGPASIAELALEQRGVHFPLVQHHWLLALLLHAAMSFSVKVKPLSLFDSKVSAHMNAAGPCLRF